MPPPRLTNANVTAIRANVADKTVRYKKLQHYNYDMAASVNWFWMYTNGPVLAMEMTNRINRDANRFMYCHARELINARGLNADPIGEKESFHLDVRFKRTGPVADRQYYFNLDIVLPSRPDGAPKVKEYELSHISFHPASEPPKYLAGTDTVDVRPASVSPFTKTGAFHLKESDNITANYQTLRRYIVYSHRSHTGAIRGREILMAYQLPHPGKPNVMFPLTIHFSRICLQVLQEYFDNNQTVNSFGAIYNNRPPAIGPHVDVAKPAALPQVATDMSASLVKNRANGLDWAQIWGGKTKLLEEIVCNVNNGANSTRLKAYCLDLYSGAAGLAALTYDAKYYPSFISLSHRSSENGGKYTIDMRLDFNIYKFFETGGAGTVEKNTVPISWARFTNNIPDGDVLTGYYQGLLTVEDIQKPGARVINRIRYTVEDTPAGGKKFVPVSQSGPITSVTSLFAGEIIKVLVKFIKGTEAGGAYDESVLNTSFYDCSGAGDSAAVAVPAVLPRIGGARKTRSGRSKKRQTRKTKKRT